MHEGGFQPATPDFAARVQASFSRQELMETLGAEVIRVAPGEVVIALPFRGDLTQQHGFLHAGVVTAVADTACGYAAYSLMPSDARVLTVEFKVSLLAPAQGESFTAKGRVVKPGRTLTFCAGEVYAQSSGGETRIATISATMMAARGRPGMPPG